MAIKKTIELNVSTKGDKELNESFKEIDKAVKTVSKDIKSLSLTEKDLAKVTKEVKNTNQAIGSVKTQLRTLEDRMAEIGDVGSPEFQKLASEAGVLRDKINNTKAAIASMSSDFPKLQVGMQAFNAVGGAAQSAAGAAALFGEENQEVVKSIQKLTAIQSVLNGVNSLANSISDETALGLKLRTTLTKVQSITTKEATFSQNALNVAQAIGAAGMRVLNAVMNANPVMLLITGITALVGAIVYFNKETVNAAEVNEELNKTLERQNELLDKTISKIQKTSEQRLRALENEGASEKVLHEERLRQLEEEELIRKAQIANLDDNITKKSKMLQIALKHDDEELAKSIKEEIEAQEEKYNTLTALDGDYLLDKQAEEKKYQEKVEQDRQANIGKYKQYLQDRKNAEIEAEDIRLQLLADGEFKDIEILNLHAKRKRNQILEDTKYTQEERQELLRLYDLKREQDEQAVRDRYLKAEKVHQEAVNEIKAPSFEDSAMVEVEQEIFTQEQLAEVRDYYRDIEREKDRAATQEKIDNAQSHLDNSMQFLNSLQSLSDAVTENQLAKAEGNEAEQEKIRKKAFERNKKLQLTMAVVQGIQGVMAAFTAGSSMGPAGVVMGPLMAALAAVTAGVNIAKIKNTSYGGGATSGASVPQDASSRVPSFNIVGNSPQNQLAQSLGGQNDTPIQTYVVSGEVSTAQSLDRNRVKTASL